jgi:hypothetical protein
MDNRFDTHIPNEYIGRKIEIIILPVFEETQPEYNAETLAAMQEALDIVDGKIKTKRYKSHGELVAEIESEIATEGDN